MATSFPTAPPLRSGMCRRETPLGAAIRIATTIRASRQSTDRLRRQAPEGTATAAVTPTPAARSRRCCSPPARVSPKTVDESAIEPNADAAPLVNLRRLRHVALGQSRLDGLVCLGDRDHRRSLLGPEIETPPRGRPMPSTAVESARKSNFRDSAAAPHSAASRRMDVAATGRAAAA
jgi:hypothetical protein